MDLPLIYLLYFTLFESLYNNIDQRFHQSLSFTDNRISNRLFLSLMPSASAQSLYREISHNSFDLTPTYLQSVEIQDLTVDHAVFDVRAESMHNSYSRIKHCSHKFLNGMIISPLTQSVHNTCLTKAVWCVHTRLNAWFADLLQRLFQCCYLFVVE